MPSIRDSILHGARKSDEVMRRLRLETRILEEWGRVDMYSIAASEEVPVLFRPLEGLLGAFLSTPEPGILINNKRPAAVQRLTCAHELGHYFLKHADSVDSDADVGAALRGDPHTSPEEAEADGFAIGFMFPRSLVVRRAELLLSSGLKPWSGQFVYQLALRLGASFEATVRTLGQFKFITPEIRRDLLETAPKVFKQSILGNVKLAAYHSDVWLISEADRTYPIVASVGDVFVVTGREFAAGGYMTHVDGLEALGFEVLAERVPEAQREDIGGSTSWEQTLQFNAPGACEATVRMGRPWEGHANDRVQYSFSVATRDRAYLGLSLEERQKRLLH